MLRLCQHGSLVAHWFLVPGDCSSNSGGGGKICLIMFELRFNIAIYFVCCVCGGRNNVEAVFKLHLGKLIPTGMMLTTKYPQ